MAFSSAKNANFEIDNSSGTLTDISAYFNSTDLDDKLAALDTTVFGDNSKAFVAGLSDATISASGIFDPTADSTLNGAKAALRDGTVTTLSWQYGPLGTGSGNPKYTGECLITDYKITNAVADVVKASLSLQITGDITRGTF